MSALDLSDTPVEGRRNRSAHRRVYRRGRYVYGIEIVEQGEGLARGGKSGLRSGGRDDSDDEG
jgi:hypothetical protein